MDLNTEQNKNITIKSALKMVDLQEKIIKVFLDSVAESDSAQGKFNSLNLDIKEDESADTAATQIKLKKQVYFQSKSCDEDHIIKANERRTTWSKSHSQRSFASSLTNACKYLNIIS